MKNTNSTTLILGLIMSILYSCKEIKNTSVAQVTLRPLEQTKTVTSLDPYIDSISIIFIEESPNTLLSYIKKTVVDKYGNYYMLTMEGDIVALDHNGAFLRKVANRGKGPKEYNNIADIAISKDGDEVLLLDNTRVLCYGITDTTLFRTIEIPHEPFDAIAPADKGGVYLFSTFHTDPYEHKNPLPMVVKVDSNERYANKDIMRTDITFSIANITQSQNTYLLRPHDNNHIVYSFEGDTIIPKYKIDFGTKTIPAQYYYTTAQEDIGKFMRADYYKVPLYLEETTNQLYFKVAGPKAEEINFIYNVNNLQGINFKDCSVDTPYIQIIYADTQCFYALVLNDTFINYDEAPTSNHGALCNLVVSRFSNIKEQILGNENPKIVKIKFNI